MGDVGRRGCLCLSAHLNQALGTGQALPYALHGGHILYSHSIPVREDPLLPQLWMG